MLNSRGPSYQMIVSTAFKIVLHSSLPFSVLMIDALHLKPCLPVYLLEPTELVSVPNPFPNMFVLKEQSFFISRNFSHFIHCIYSWVKC